MDAQLYALGQPSGVSVSLEVAGESRSGSVQGRERDLFRRAAVAIFGRQTERTSLVGSPAPQALFGHHTGVAEARAYQPHVAQQPDDGGLVDAAPEHAPGHEAPAPAGHVALGVVETRAGEVA